MKKRITALIMALVLMMSMAVGAVAASVEQFTDVAPTDWYYTYVKDVVSKNYMNGTSKSTFSPNDNLTRAMAGTVLARVEKVKVDNAADSGFVDVPVNQWYTGSVKWMFEKKLVKGYGNNKFGPSDFITRQDAAVMMANYLKMKGYKETGKNTVVFGDMAKVSAYAKDSVKLCADAGIIVGVPNGNFEPLRNITRAEFASMIRKLDKVVYGTIGSGGSSDGPSVTSATYNVKVNATVNSDISALNQTLNLTSRDYTVWSNGSGDKTVAQVVQDLVADESLALKNAIGQGINAAKGQTKTVTVAGKTATVKIDPAGKISVETEMDMTALGGISSFSMGRASTFARRAITTFAARSYEPSMDDVNKMMAAIQDAKNSGSETFELTTPEQKNALVYLHEKAAEIAVLDPDEIKDKIQEMVGDNEALQQMVDGIDAKQLKKDLTDYVTNLQPVVSAIESGATTLPTPKGSVSTVTVKMDMRSYLNKATAKYNTYMTDDDTQTRVVNAFNNRYKDAYTRAGLDPATATLATWDDLKPLYVAANPDDLVTANSDGTLSMKTTLDDNGNPYYSVYDVLVAGVNASAALWDKLDTPAAVYEYAINKAKGETFAPGDALADVLSKQTGFMNGRNDVLLLTVSATDSIEDVVFNKIKNLLAGRITLSTNPIGDVIDTMDVTVVLDKR